MIIIVLSIITLMYFGFALYTKTIRQDDWDEGDWWLLILVYWALVISLLSYTSNLY